MQTMTSERVERFKAEAADLNLKAGKASKDAQLQALGLVLMVVGVIGAFVSFLSATGVEATGDVVEMVVLAIAFLTLSVLGGAVFLRYSISKFLRIWLLRQSYESQSHIDQVLEAAKRS